MSDGDMDRFLPSERTLKNITIVFAAIIILYIILHSYGIALVDLSNAQQFVLMLLLAVIFSITILIYEHNETNASQHEIQSNED